MTRQRCVLCQCVTRRHTTKCICPMPCTHMRDAVRHASLTLQQLWCRPTAETHTQPRRITQTPATAASQQHENPCCYPEHSTAKLPRPATAATASRPTTTKRLHRRQQQSMAQLPPQQLQGWHCTRVTHSSQRELAPADQSSPVIFFFNSSTSFASSSRLLLNSR